VPWAPAGSSNVRARVGEGAAGKLLRSTDPEERLRGIERAASCGSAECVNLLAQAAEPSSAVRTDGRAMIALARALAPFAEQERVQKALLALVNAGSAGLAGRLPQARGEGALALEEGDPVQRATLARQIAALALASGGGDRATDLLYGAARSGGSGQGPALAALTAFPPRDPAFLGSPSASLPVPVIRFLGELGDLRALERLHAAARSPDAQARAAAILAIAQLGDERGIALARTAIVERDVRMRAAAGEALVLLGAPERVSAVTALVSDEATTALGVKLAERVFHPEIVKLLAARARVHPDADVRLAAIQALGRSPDGAAAIALTSPEVIGDPRVQYQAALALARSPAPNAGALVAQLAGTDARRKLGVRAYVVRALQRGDRDDAGDAAARLLASSRAVEERALGTFAKVALGDMAAKDALDDPAPAVRRAAVMGALAWPSRDTDRAMIARSATETDPIVRQLLLAALARGEGPGALPSNRLLDRAEGGGADAPLAALAYARREGEDAAAKVGQLLASKDATLRAHVALGLAGSPLPDATGRLARAYAFETDDAVRRAIVTALAARTNDASAPLRKATLAMARFDPDLTTRRIAQAAVAGTAAPLGPAVRTEVAWLRLVRDDGTPPGAPFAAALVRADGLAQPIAFDEDGYAIAPGLPPGEVRLVLTPRLPRD
jgi:hypothetical protein